MFYVTVPVGEIHHQMTLEELFSGVCNFQYTNPKGTNTKTYEVKGISNTLAETYLVDPYKLYMVLKKFNDAHEDLFKEDMHEFYREFYIPKKSHGFRKIDAPNDELMGALRELKEIFETEFHAMYHTSAFAYIKRRCTIDALKRHQAAESKWFAKYDLSNFFGSTTLDFVMQQLGMVYPFSRVVEEERGREELRKALSLGFLDGGLPQGTPLSPLITNVIMIPIDFNISKRLRSYKDQRFVYTRYADDFLVSSRKDFDSKEIQDVINEVMKDFDAPYKLNSEKTRYGSSAGQNWNLGLMLNADNEITVGHKRKRQLKAAINSYIMDGKHGHMWGIEDLQVLLGQINYCMMVEEETIKGIIRKFNKKYDVDVLTKIRGDISFQTATL